MQPTFVEFDLIDTADPAFDAPLEAMLIALIAFGPLSLGAVQAWSETILFAIVGAMAIVLAVKLLRRRDVPLVWSPAYWPMSLFVAMVVLQLAPLPASAMRVISPHTFALNQQLLADLPDAGERLKWMTLSFYPEATLHDLKVLLAAIAVFVVVLNSIRRPSQVKRILTALAIIGSAVALLALAQDVSETTEIYWLIPNPAGRAVRGGPFINRSHFGQFMNLSIGAALAMLLAHVRQHFRRSDYTPEEIQAKLRAPAMRPIGLALAACIFGAASVMFSLSRGAILSAAVAGIVVTLAIVTRRGARGLGWLVFVLILCVGGVVLFDLKPIMQRLHAEPNDWQGNRLQILRDLTAAWKQFPLFGTGLGSFQVVFPMFDRSTYTYFATHAENEYAQLLTETGLVGLFLAITFIFIISRDVVRAIRGEASSASSLALGLSFGWLAILLHSGTDFGQHVPVIACLTATIAALLSNLAHLRKRERNEVSMEFPPRGKLWTRAVGLAVPTIVLAAVLIDHSSMWRAQSAWESVKRIDADLQRRKWSAENAEYADILTAAETSAKLRPRNIEYQYWLNFYRWKSIARVRAELDGAALPEMQKEFAQRIVDALHAARWLAPTYGNPSLLAGEIEHFELDHPKAGRRDLERAVMLCGPDPTAAYLLGQVQVLEGEIEPSMANLRRAVELDPGMRLDVSDFYLRQLNRPDLALEVAGEDLPALDALAGMFEQRKDDPSALALARDARAKADLVLERLAARDDAPGDLIARHAAVLADRGDHEHAIDEYRRALARKYGETDWRMALAHSLEKAGRPQEALREAEACLLRRPRMADALEMVQRLGPKPQREPVR